MLYVKLYCTFENNYCISFSFLMFQAQFTVRNAALFLPLGPLGLPSILIRNEYWRNFSKTHFPLSFLSFVFLDYFVCNIAYLCVGSQQKVFRIKRYIQAVVTRFLSLFLSLLFGQIQRFRGPESMFQFLGLSGQKKTVVSLTVTASQSS